MATNNAMPIIKLKTTITTPKTRTIMTLIFAFLLTGCTLTDRVRIAKAITSNAPEKQLGKLVVDKGKQYTQTPGQLITDLKSFSQLFSELKSAVAAVWGNKNIAVSSNKKYVKYTNNYQSKAQVDFSKGIITVETIAQKQPLAQLKEAIVMTLLTNDNPANTDIFSAKSPQLSGKPYLLNQVLDHDNQPIAYQWRASRFADHLIAHQLKKHRVSDRQAHYVEIAMVSSHTQLRKNQYANYVLASANKYQIKPDLIYAIIETESSFNPFAVSQSNAYGLMQVVPATAGKDVYEKVHKRSGMPSQQTLFSPKDNIDIGTAYLHILQSNYLKKINDSISRHFAMISAYNGGAGNVFNTFSRDRSNASTVINKLPPEQVYQQLTKKHPRAESRRYLEKVTKAEKNYR